MADRGMRAVTDMAGRHPSLKILQVNGEPCIAQLTVRGLVKLRHD